MKYRHIFYLVFFISFCGICSNSTAQKEEITYYNSSWKKCDASKACFQSQVLKTDSGYYRRDYFVNNGALQMAALYEDKVSKIQNGQATYFYADGKLERMVKKVHGKTEGVNIGYHYNGVMSDSGMYSNGQPIGATFEWHVNGTMSDSVATGQDSIRTHFSWFDDGTPAAAGREMNDKKTGTWVYYYRNGNRAAREVYKDGKAISTQHFDESGKNIAVDTSRNEHPASFSGGVDGWIRYLEGALVYPEDVRQAKGKEIVILVRMTVGENGKIKDVYLVNPIHPAFDKVAYDVIRKAPDWEPAIQYNRPVEYRFVQAVTFALQ